MVYVNKSLSVYFSYWGIKAPQLMYSVITNKCTLGVWLSALYLLYLLILWNSFDDFLMDMKQSKRKNIRQERKKVSLYSRAFELAHY